MLHLSPASEPQSVLALDAPPPCMSQLRAHKHGVNRKAFQVADLLIGR